MNWASLAARHIRALLFLTMCGCVVGAALLPGFPVAILPDVTFPRLVVIANAGERPSRFVEVIVTRPLEQAISTVPGVSRIRSKTQRGATELSVDFVWGTDVLMALQMVNTRIGDARAQFPADVTVSAERMNPTVFPILGLSLQSRHLSQAALWQMASFDLRPRLSSVPGVARVEIQGGRVPEIAVEVRPERLGAYRLSLLDVGQALMQSNVVRAVGRIDQSFQQQQILVAGTPGTEEGDPVSRLGRVVVSQRNGIPLTVGALADIHPSTEDRTTVVTADGAPAVLLNVVRQPDASTLDVVERVRQVLDDWRAHAPRGTELGVFYDQSTLIRDAISSVRDAVLVGALLAVVVLMVFLRQWRATVVTAAIIPLTLLITFVFMRAFGLSMNLMTLGALAVGIGLIIDDAIVIVENVFRHQALGESLEQAVRSGTSEMASPMVSSTLTTVVVFLPLGFLSGVPGAFFSPLAVTLAIALLISLALALLVSPALCLTFLPRTVAPSHAAGAGANDAGAAESPGREVDDVRERGNVALPWQAYRAVLEFGMRRRAFLPLLAAVLVTVTVVLASRLGTGFMPSMDEGAFVLDYWTPPGTSLAESDRLLRKIDALLAQTPEVASYSRRTGTELGFGITEPNRGDYAITLKRDRKRGVDAITDGLRDAIGQQVPGIEIEFVQVLQDLIGDLAGASAPIEVKLFGEQQASLEEGAARLSSSLRKVKGIVDVKSGVVEAGPELVVEIDAERAGRLGLSADAVASQAQAALFGDVVTQLVQGDRRLNVRVRYPAAWRADLQAVGSMPIRAPGGFVRPLGSLGRIRQVAGTTELTRENQRRVVIVSARLSGLDLGTGIAHVRRRLAELKLPAGVTWELGGQYQSEQEAFRNLMAVLGAAVMLVFVVMLFGFESFTAPVLIVLLLPLSLFGVVVALWATGTAINVSSFMGAVMLVGIVVKNGILLLERARHAETEGLDAEAAAVQAACQRFRPIVMTTATALLGLVPLAAGWGAGAEMQKPLAIAVIGGLTFSTLFTLLFAPIMYAGIRRWQQSRDPAAQETAQCPAGCPVR